MMEENELKRLFEEGECLTFDYTSTLKNFSYYKKLRESYKRAILLKSKTAIFALESPTFHYFNNGILLCSKSVCLEVLNRFKKILKQKGYILRKEYFYSSSDRDYDFLDMCEISEYACQKYSCEQDVKIEVLPSPKKFAQELLAKNNICYTASKTENIDPKYRKFLALFSDGRFIVSDEYSFDSPTHDYLEVKDFCREYKKYLYLRAEYVPQRYIDAIYKQAKVFDWFMSEEEHIAMWKKTHYFPRNSQKAIEMNRYIDELLRDNECLSVVNPLQNIMSPDRLKYALFADGSLVVDEKLSYWEQDDLCKELAEIFPHQKFILKTVPSSYIPEIYEWLLLRQKSAKQLYIEMLIEKVNHLQKKLNLSIDDAKKAVLKSSGFDSWETIDKIEESQARYLINLEKAKIKNGKELNLDYTLYEYRKNNC